MKKIILMCLLVLFGCNKKSTEPECTSGEFDECGVCDGPGEVPTTHQNCGWVTDCGYVTVSLGSNSYCANSCINGYSCSWNSDCYYNNGFAGSGCNSGYYCVTTTQDYQCQDVYECYEYTTYSCP